MAKNKGPRTVQCYHCRHRFEVGGRAQSTSCPGCNKPLIVEDKVIDKMVHGQNLYRTCGKITIKKKGRLMAKLIEAHDGIICEGVIEADQVISGKTLVLGKTSTFHGNLHAPAVDMALGAKVKPCLFEVPSDPLGLADLGRDEVS